MEKCWREALEKSVAQYFGREVLEKSVREYCGEVL